MGAEEELNNFSKLIGQSRVEKLSESQLEAKMAAFKQKLSRQIKAEAVQEKSFLRRFFPAIGVSVAMVTLVVLLAGVWSNPIYFGNSGNRNGNNSNTSAGSESGGNEGSGDNANAGSNNGNSGGPTSNSNSNTTGNTDISADIDDLTKFFDETFSQLTASDFDEINELTSL